MCTVGERWVGLSVVHLGDRDVPNALVFIDKYTQIPRILRPLVDVSKFLGDKNMHSPQVSTYIEEEFGEPESLNKAILCDFFKVRTPMAAFSLLGERPHARTRPAAMYVHVETPAPGVRASKPGRQPVSEPIRGRRLAAGRVKALKH